MGGPHSDVGIQYSREHFTRDGWSSHIDDARLDIKTKTSNCQPEVESPADWGQKMFGEQWEVF